MEVAHASVSQPCLSLNHQAFTQQLHAGNATADPAVACTDKEYGDAQYMIGVVDLVQVPDLPDGDYVVSWRYDAEQTKQGETLM